LPAPGTNRGRRAAAATLSARLVTYVTLEARTDGSIAACFAGRSVALGKFSASVAERAQDLLTGLPLGSFASEGRTTDEEIHRLVRRLAGHGLLEYHLSRSRDGTDEVVIEPQIPDYWPRVPQLRQDDILALSRFAYLRRRGNEMVMESPRAGALFKICNPQIAAAVALLATPQQVKKLRRREDFFGIELLALLVDCQILFKIDGTRDSALRSLEGDDNLVLWDFHDLLFHTRSVEGRHANPTGGTYPYAGVMAPLPAVRPRWPGKKVDLREFADASSQPILPAAKLLRERHSTRTFDDQQPITLAELARFLDATARVHSSWKSKLDLGDDAPVVDYAARSYPSGGSSYELELYLAVDKCEGLARGFYHYDAGAHALAPIVARAAELDALLAGAQFAMGSPAVPQVLITIAARFGRISWKYSSIAYALVLKDVGVLMQTLYLMTSDMGLGGCAIGTANVDLFAKMTGIEFHVEGPVGQFAIGRGAKPRFPTEAS
jgi:SagB-type dehydrogenase family enzyme